MQRGEVWWIDFNPSIGGEIQKTRPAIVVSNNTSNKILNRLQVVPITSNIDKCFPCEAYIEIAGKISKAMADQLTTVSKLRLKNKIGTVSAQSMVAVEQAIKIQLGL